MVTVIIKNGRMDGGCVATLLMFERNMHFVSNNKIIESRSCNKSLPQGSSLAHELQSLINAGVGAQLNNVQDTIAVALNSGSSGPLSALTKFFHCSELSF